MSSASLAHASSYDSYLYPNSQLRRNTIVSRPTNLRPLPKVGCSPRSTIVYKMFPALEPGALTVHYFASSTFQYTSLTKVDQLSIRTSCAV
jgi:hypothetical protein